MNAFFNLWKRINFIITCCNANYYKHKHKKTGHKPGFFRFIVFYFA